MKNITIGQLASKMSPGKRLCISFPKHVDLEGNHKWIGPLTDAQILAYQDHVIQKGGERAKTYYCIVDDVKN